ncbi:hypothetical protein STEG23_012583, partial [Scotinomys teguina]
MGHTSRIMEDSGTESNVDYDGLTQEVPKEKDISALMLCSLRDHRDCRSSSSNHPHPGASGEQTAL